MLEFTFWVVVAAIGVWGAICMVRERRRAASLAASASALMALDPPPMPYDAFPGTEPWSGAWRQGLSEHWLCERFLPYWRSVSPEVRKRRLSQSLPPTDDWRDYLTELWVPQRQGGPPSR